MDAEKLIDRILEADLRRQRWLEAQVIRSKINGRSRCGQCFYWMKNTCPKEKSVNGYKRGPSSSGVVCQKFLETERSKQHKADAIAKAERLEALAVEPTTEQEAGQDG